jgi:hypothetical protein
MWKRDKSGWKLEKMFIMTKAALGAEKGDEYYVGSEYFWKLNGISYDFTSNAFSCSPFLKYFVSCTLWKSSKTVFNKSSLILENQA